MANRKTLTIDEVKFDGSIYPREKWRGSTVDKFVDDLRSGAEFPPIVVEAGSNRLLDGKHRLEAIRKYRELHGKRAKQEDTDLDKFEDWADPIDNIPVDVHTIPDGVPGKLYAASLSAKHGDRIAPGERKKIAREIFEDNPDFTLDVLSRYLGVSKSTAAEYVADIRGRRAEERKVVAYRLHRLGWTQQEIGSVVGLSQSKVNEELLSGFPEMEKGIKNTLAKRLTHAEVATRSGLPEILVWAVDLQDAPDDGDRLKRLGVKIQPYDVWNFSSCGDLFGREHPGRIPGILIAHVLYYFTKPGDVVFDPMAGGGTTLDVCLAMNRRCYAYDIDLRHERPDVIEHDIAKEGWHQRIKKADLIFWDPPYYNKKDYAEGSVSKLSKDAYMDFFVKALEEAYSQVKRGTILAFLMSDFVDKKAIPGAEGLCFWNYADTINDAGWSLLRHIQVPLPSQQIHASFVEDFRENRELGRLNRYLIIARA